MNNNPTLQQEVGYNPRLFLMNNLKMIIFILILGIFSAGVLVGLEYYTGPRVERNNRKRLMEGVLDSMGYKYGTDNVLQIFEENITSEREGNMTFYRDNNGTVAFQFTGEGLWAPIKGVIAFKSDLSALEGISIIEQAETPGLGGRITEEEFLRQFRGLSFEPQIEILKAGNKAEEANEVDGLTGATMTSEAMETILNVNIEKALQRLEVR